MLSETFSKQDIFVFSSLEQLHFNKFPLILMHFLSSDVSWPRKLEIFRSSNKILRFLQWYRLFLWCFLNSAIPCCKISYCPSFALCGLADFLTLPFAKAKTFLICRWGCKYSFIPEVTMYLRAWNPLPLAKRDLSWGWTLLEMKCWWSDPNRQWIWQEFGLTITPNSATWQDKSSDSSICGCWATQPSVVLQVWKQPSVIPSL